MSRSLHEISAAAHPGPEDSGTSSSSDQGGYFSWQVSRRMKTPAVIPTISATDVTPDRTLRALLGQTVFLDLPDADEQTQIPLYRPSSIPKPSTLEHAKFRSGRRAAASRRKKIAGCKDRGGINTQNYGRGRR
jgi:hypothetical protein